MTTQAQTAGRPGYVPDLGPLGKVVATAVAELQACYLRDDASARAQLAQLRGAQTRPVGTVPAVWDLTVGIAQQATADGRPAWEPADGSPTREEVAAHQAMTLYALHQQSRTSPMHRWGPGLGQAVRQLGADGNDVAVRRRFDAVATASSVTEVAHHLRGLVSQLRSAEIALDYGQLAHDLVALQTVPGARTVRLRWARQYYRTTGTPVAESSTTTTPASARLEEN